MGEATPGLLSPFHVIGPELVLAAAACGFFLFAAFVRRTDVHVRDAWAWSALASILFAAAAWIPEAHTRSQGLASSLLHHDHLAWFVRGASLLGGFLLVLVGWTKVPVRQAGEYYGCLLLTLAGLNFIGMANDLVGLFLALELVSIPTYVLLYLARKDGPAQEAAIKYFLLSIFSSALVLYGLSFLYGAVGSTNLEVIRSALRGSEAAAVPDLLMLSMVLVVSGLGFRITAFPFHFYAPDVFQGTTATMAAFLSFVPKVAGFAALFRLVAGVMLFPTGGFEGGGAPIQELAVMMGTLAAVTMFAGNILALVQDDVRRLMAYSGVAHAGYMLVALAVGQPEPMAVPASQAVLFYLVVYGAMTIGVFAVLVALSRPKRTIKSVQDLRGLFHTNPYLAVAMTVFLFSLIGLPPTAGFVGKLQLLLAILSKPSPVFWTLAVILAVNSAIGAYYYLQVVVVMFSPGAKATFEGRRHDAPSLAAVALCLLITLGLFFTPNVLLRLLQNI